MKASDNPFPDILVEEVATDGSVTGTPAADFRRLFLGEDGALHLKDSSGTVTDVSGGSGDVSTDAIWDAKGDIAGGTGSNTAQRLAVGTDGYVLTADSGATTGLAWTEATGGTGGGYYLDSNPALDGTYGDDFTDATIGTAKWTRHNQTMENSGVAGTWLELDMSRVTGTAMRGYYQALTDADEVLVDLSLSLYGFGSDQQFGPYIVSSTGTGVGFGVSVSGALQLHNLTSYARASEFAVSADSSLVLGTFDRGQKMWLRLAKRAGLYVGSVSMNGSVWSAWTPGGVPGAFTPEKVGFGLMYVNGGTIYRISVDRFNCVTKDYGDNLCRTPSGGTATASASSEYSGSYSADKAVDGSRTTGDWAATNNTLPTWWKMTWSEGQSLNRVLLFGRNTEQLGNAYIAFSDGSNVMVNGPITLGGTVVEFATKTGITTMQINSIGDGNGSPGLTEVEAYLAS